MSSSNTAVTQGGQGVYPPGTVFFLAGNDGTEQNFGAIRLTVPPGAMDRPIGVYSTFLPARGAQLAVNGEAATAKVYLQDRFGKPASSCVLAWSETWTRPAA